MTYTTVWIKIKISAILFMDYILLFLNDIHNLALVGVERASIVYGLYFTFFE